MRLLPENHPLGKYKNQTNENKHNETKKENKN